MRKVVLPFVVAALLVLSGSDAIAGALTQTMHFGSFVQDITGVSCAGPVGDIAIDANGNGVIHFTANTTGSWFTATFEGTGTVTVTSPGTAPAVYTGHFQLWDSDEANLQNAVSHATLNFDGADASGASFHMHAAFQMTLNANGTLTASHFTASCS